MVKQRQKTCEFVTPKHPDKMCDVIADSILDAYLTRDSKSRVAVEVMGGHGLITVNGEVTSKSDVDVEAVVKGVVDGDYRAAVNLEQQSVFIAQGVDSGGAGDQGIMIGYAVRESPTFMPHEYELARELCEKIYEKYPVDGKVQVTLAGEDVRIAVASFQNVKTPELEKLLRSFVEAEQYFVNPAGEWTLGGFDADSGVSGRKLVVDNYGPSVPVGGGSFSGKDATKVDRSGAYMARRVAVDLLERHGAQEVFVRLAYVIGIAEPVMAITLVDGKEMEVKGYDLTPQGIIDFLGLAKPMYVETAKWGHFGRGYTWR